MLVSSTVPMTSLEKRSMGGFRCLTGTENENIVGSASGLTSFLPHWKKKSLG